MHTTAAEMRAVPVREMTAEQVISLYGDMVYRLAYSIVRSQDDANDMFQEVFLRYIRDGGEFENEEHRKRWLMRVTVNCCKSFYRSAARKNTVPIEEREFSAKEEYSDLEMRVDLAQAMDQLKPDDRTLLHLFYFEDRTIAQISAILSRPSPLVKVQLSRARAKLKNCLKGVYEI